MIVMITVMKEKFVKMQVIIVKVKHGLSVKMEFVLILHFCVTERIIVEITVMNTNVVSIIKY